jgi:GT2 family glycosyltransferase
MNLFVRKSTFKHIGGFNEELVTCEDVDFSYRLKMHGDIISDSRINVIHLGEAKTIKEFFKKELWRGRSNIVGIFSHGLTLKEIPSLSIPIYFGIYMPLLLIILIISPSLPWVILAILSYIIPFISILFRKRKILNLLSIIKLAYLLNVYFISRTIAVIKIK